MLTMTYTHILRTKQRGVGLVEVLVAVLVIAFGMLGIVGLQMFSLRSNQSSMERGLAVVQTHSIVDAMRADRTSASNDLFDIASTATPSGTTFAAVALTEWRANLVTALGDGATGSVSCNGMRCTITVIWNDSRAGGDTATTHSVVTEVQL